MSDVDVALAKYRAEIDQIDTQLLNLLNERAKAALAIGRLKKAEGLPVFVPEREQQVVASLSAQNSGPLRSGMIAAVYREIMAQMKQLEEAVDNEDG